MNTEPPVEHHVMSTGGPSRKRSRSARSGDISSETVEPIDSAIHRGDFSTHYVRSK